MRKWLAALIVLLLIIFCVYWFIPGKTNIHQKLVVPVNTKAFAREILNEHKWQQWWPGKKIAATRFEYNGNTYALQEKKLSSLMITISSGTDSIFTELIFLPVQHDSIELSWNGNEAGANFIKSIQHASRIKHLKSDIDFLLQKINSFYSNEDNLYGLHIEKALVPDSNLVSTSAITKSYPDMKTVYGLIDKIKTYIQNKQAKELAPPMLNIYKNTDSSYLARVAIPTDKKLSDAGDVHYRWMLQGGNILVAEVKGGPHQIEGAFAQMANYIEDHHRTAPAIPFQSLITDRRQEPDTNKWITKLYWPVM